MLDALKPRGIRAVGVMSMVRNNIGPDAYSCDEVVTTRAGKRVRIVNTDAEGRMAMMDPLFEMKERVWQGRNAQKQYWSTAHHGLTGVSNEKKS